MKKHLRYFTIILALGINLIVYSQQSVSLRIIKTGDEGGVDISIDDGEFENDVIDKFNDDDLDMGWEGEDLNIMTTFLRYQNVGIPQGATIDSAFINFYAHEDEADEARITIFAEATDNSALFVETETITSRVWTNASISWTITEPWVMWQPYRTPELKSLIQEVVNRQNWSDGNSLTLFFRGEDQGASLLDNARDFESFENIEDPDDGGDGLHHPERIPELVVYYTITTHVVEAVIETTGDEGGVAISYDDGEFENDVIDKFNDDDLDMGWEGEDLNIMTTFLRFRNIQIPQHANIESAYIHFYAHEDEADEARITIFGEATDNSPIFVETELINDRTWTTASVPWTITEEWSIWQPYVTPDLKNLIQEIVSRSGWANGNALTLFFRGEDQGASLLDNARDFESFENIEDPEDGGDGLHHPERIPRLVITYSGYTSINDFTNQKLNELMVYPSVSNNGLFTIYTDNDENHLIEVYNSAGARINSFEQSTKKIELDLSSFGNGFFVVRVTSGNQQSFCKLIKL
ncbi:MAG: T9SS type A sorting domain-containing protein [Bacteroidales bacterium]|jgi:hypothetical protein